MPDRNEDLIDTLTDLIGRLETAGVNLVMLAEERKPLSHERIRLEGKANGISLAKSYAREELKRAQNA